MRGLLKSVFVEKREVEVGQSLMVICHAWKCGACMVLDACICSYGGLHNTVIDVLNTRTRAQHPILCHPHIVYTCVQSPDKVGHFGLVNTMFE